mmetsp:Transcript_35534/g.81398  ORF Transcript_35534/g.81398 Transcript_35534/m.81398 type:complete len:219 (+) Transcript_35534:1052-1708(+)
MVVVHFRDKGLYVLQLGSMAQVPKDIAQLDHINISITVVIKLSECNIKFRKFSLGEAGTCLEILHEVHELIEVECVGLRIFLSPSIFVCTLKCLSNGLLRECVAKRLHNLTDLLTVEAPGARMIKLCELLPVDVKVIIPNSACPYKRLMKAQTSVLFIRIHASAVFSTTSQQLLLQPERDLCRLWAKVSHQELVQIVCRYVAMASLVVGMDLVVLQDL